MTVVDSYKRLEKIGEGTYGIVYRAIHKQTKMIVALKKIRPENEEEGVSPTTLREISILKSIKNKRIISILDIMCNDKNIFIVYEYCEIDLRKMLDSYKMKNEKMDSLFTFKISKEIIEGITYLHRRNIIHRDLKPQNILINKRGNIKIADFGLSRKINLPLRSLTKDVITLWYRPPELLLSCSIYNTNIDIWSYGCILSEILNYKPLFPGDSEIDQLVKIFTILGTPTSETWRKVSILKDYQENFPIYKPIDLSNFIKEPFFQKIITKCLIYDPLERVPAYKLLEEFRAYEEEKELKCTSGSSE